MIFDDVRRPLHVKKLSQTISIRHLPRIKEPDVHCEDEDSTDIVPYGGNLEDGVGYQPGHVDDTAEESNNQDTPSRIQLRLYQWLDRLVHMYLDKVEVVFN